MDNNEIRVKMDGGYLVASRNPSREYDGIAILFETNDGDLIDVVMTECKAEDDFKKIDVYCYEDVWQEDFTKKYSLSSSEIYKALSGGC